jgi:hypothetical protein
VTEAERLLQHVAAVVADGEEADWDAVDRRLRGRPEAAVATRLKLVQTVQQDGLSGSSGLRLRPTAAGGHRDVLGAAVRSLLILSTLQLGGAIVGLRAALPVAGVPVVPGFLTALGFGSAAAVLAHTGRRDRRALYLAGFFLGVASATSHRFLEAIPAGLFFFPARLLATLLPETFLPFFLWGFAREFPRVIRFDRWAPFVASGTRLSALVGAVLFAANAARRWLPVPWQGGLLDLLARRPSGPYWLLLSALCLPVPVVAWARARLASPQERRRVRFFLLGLGAGVLPLFAGVAAESLWPSFARFMGEPHRRIAATVVYLGLLLTVPVSTAYAVLAHRLLDVRLLLRRAGRVAITRRSLLVCGALPTLVLCIHLYRLRASPLGRTLTEPPGPGLLAAAAFGWALLYGAGRIERWLAPRFGGQPATELALAAFGSDVRQAHSLATLAAAAARRLCELMGAEQALLLPYDARSETYRGTEGGPRSLAATSAIARFLATSQTPLSLAAEGRDSLLPWLLEEDRQWMADAEASLVAAVPAPQGGASALLVVGAARDGRRYGRRDLQALAAFSATTALAIERLAHLAASAVPGAADADGEAAECRSCGWVGRRGEDACGCGGALARAAIPWELGGKFRLARVLGRGGMGVVYLADDLALSRQVALKTLPQMRTDTLLRLRKEARSMAGFVHPNLPLIFGLETWRGVPVLVVEYLAGGTLASRIGARLGADQVLRWGLELVAAIEVMHGQGLLHRDIKPSNIGFTLTGVPKLLDFGLAHLAAETGAGLHSPGEAVLSIPDAQLRMTLSGHVAGTPLYLPPEAFAGAAPSVLNDLWAFHLVLWETLAGQHPCAGMGLAAALRHLASGTLPDVRDRRPDCPAALAELLANGLHSDPRHRLSSAGAVRQALLAVASPAS